MVLVTRLVPGLSDVLQNLEVRWELTGGFSGSFAPLYHPGTLLVGGLLIGAAIQRRSWRAPATAFRTALGQVGPVVIALVAMLGLSRIMVAAGMIDTLAQAASDAAGDSWPLFVPLVGALGTFITGSATASNILFTDFQLATAQITLDLANLFQRHGGIEVSRTDTQQSERGNLVLHQGNER